MNKTLAILLSFAAISAQAQVPHIFQSGDTISAAEINANFDYLSSRVDTGQPGTASRAILHSRGTLTTVPEPLVKNAGGSQSFEVLYVYSAAGAFLTLDCSGETIRFGSGTAAQARIQGLFVPPGCDLMGYSSANSTTYTYIVSYVAR